MNKLRLVITEECSRNCPGCCMNQPPVVPDEILSDQLQDHPAQDVFITGGEPMLESWFNIASLCEDLEKYGKKRYLYSAYAQDLNRWMSVLPYIDGITFTIHDRTDLSFFVKLNEAVVDYMETSGRSLSIWLNVFEFTEQECQGMEMLFNKWNVRMRTWKDNCPLPDGEDFRRLIW